MGLFEKFYPDANSLGVILPIECIAPSRYALLKQCALREIWTSNRKEPLLPLIPVARLGTVIHQFFEISSKTRYSAQELDGRWNLLIQKVEREMQDSILDKPLLPLQKSVSDYEVRKIRAFRRATEISQQVLPSENSKRVYKVGNRILKSQFELRVQSKDGLIVGYIDEVVKDANGYILRDYKSGNILNFNPDTQTNEVNVAYQTQLKLYAALFDVTYGAFPVRLEVVPPQGKAIEVECNQLSCKSLLSEALEKLENINHAIRSLQAENASCQESCLATPAPVNCQFCRFRPACFAYHTSSIQSNARSKVKDIWGEIISATRLGNGRLSLNLRTSIEGNCLEVNIRGITPNSDRHPIFQFLRPGEYIALYNLQGDFQARSFKETQLTTIYRFRKP
jgi:RecB family exonuclease